MRSSLNDSHLLPRCRRTRAVAQAALALSVVAATGCNRTNNVDQSVTNNTANNVSKIFGPEGGHMDGPGGTELDLPPGALNEEVEITIGEVVTGAPETPAGFSDPSTVFAFLPHGQTFALDVTISIPHQGGPNANVVAFRADPSGEFEEIAVEATTDLIATVRSPSFSYYGTALGEVEGSTSTTDATTSTTDPTDDPTTGSGGGFIEPPDMGGGPPLQCDVWVQDCGSGQKCMPYDSSESGEWDANGCFNVDPDAVGPGAPCAVVESATSGMDNCELGFMCWNVDPDSGEGVCTEFCAGNESSPVCSGDANCDVQFQGTVPLCIQPCDPLAQDCGGGQACYFGEAPYCAPDESGGAGNAGDPCDVAGDCAAGNQCAGTRVLDACAGASCCTPFCDISLGNCVNAALTCTPLYEEGNVPPGGEDYGWCVLPK